MAEAVYIACATTALLCAVLLVRAFLRTRTALLLWSAICFAGLAASNVLVFVDLILVPQIDLSLIRAALSAVSTLALAAGLMWMSEERR
jgi:hypothetical protein